MIDRLIGRTLAGKLGLLPSFAASMAFYFLTSLVPFLVLLTQAVAWLFSANLTPEIARFLNAVLPPESELRPEAIVASVQAMSGRGLGPASAAVAVWTGSSFLNEVARAVHYIFSDPERPHAGGWIRWLKSLALLAAWVAVMAAATVFLVLLPLAQEEMARRGARPGVTQLLGGAARYPTATAVLLAAFFVTFLVVPERRVSRPAAMGGALVAAAWWSGTCALFSYFLPKVWEVSLFHGALSSALAVLVWAYCGAWGVLAGASVAARFDEA